MSTSGVAIQTGDDCNDDDANLYPGHPEACSTSDAGVIMWPTGSPTGICKYGSISCEANGTESACTGAQGPEARNCSSSMDNDCDGKADSSECTCTIGSTQACYSGPAGTEGVGSCKGGTQACETTDGGTSWAACTGQTTPAARDCTSAADNDCDGKADDTECGACTTNAVRSCYTGPSGTEGVGICAGGQQTCELTNGQTAWGACSGETTPGIRNCTSATDNDCDGTADNQEAACDCSAGHLPGSTQTCGGAAYCTQGTETCIANGSSSTWGACVGLTSPTAKTSSGGAPISFTDATGQDVVVGTVAPPPGFPGTSWTLPFTTTQSGNVDNTHTATDPNGPAGRVACADGSSTLNLGSEDFSSATWQMTCAYNVSIVFYKMTNWGGGCCGGYTRTYTMGTVRYTGC